MGENYGTRGRGVRVCVIGAGVSGLPAIKACLEENLDVVCYERTAEIGGLWNYRPDLAKVGATVMKSTVVNTSKEMMAYSDFVPPAEWPNFMHHSYVKRYLEMYARHYDLQRHIRFNTTVDTVERDQSVGGWTVRLSDGKTERFDKIMLCTGHHVKPQYPEINGMHRFKGRILHAKEYRDFTGFQDANVFIVGIGNSALDIAVELTKVAKTVTVSTRRGTWIFNRVGPCGLPYDLLYMTRFYRWRMGFLPWTVANDYMEYRVQQRMNHELYGLRPKHRFFQQHPTVNDALANLLVSGLITITEDVDSFTENEVIVTDGRKYPADIVILATGYTFEFPYLRPQSLIPITDHQVDLFKFVFPPNSPDLAAIGLIQPIGSVSPISEMQCRWVARVFAGATRLPDASTMRADILRKRRAMRRRYFHSNKHTIQVDFTDYMDELAEIVGCRPQLTKILLEDPWLAARLFFGANVPYVYRLSGPNSWPKARDTIWTVPNRVKLPLKHRQCHVKNGSRRGTLDEYFGYVSLKWILGYGCLILFVGLWTFCSPIGGISIFAYFTYVFIFLTVFTILLLWFDLQYDMSTVF